MSASAARARRSVLGAAALATLGGLACSLTGCFPVPLHIASAPSRFEASQLEGTWYVAASNFPMWVSGDKKNPTFEYALMPDDGETVKVDDAVRFEVDGKPDAFLGIDEQDPGSPTHFTWRGKGGLLLFSSDWYVAAIADDGAWAVVYYTATIASPDGVDIIARTKKLPKDRLAEAEAAIARDTFLRDKAKGLVVVGR